MEGEKFPPSSIVGIYLCPLGHILLRQGLRKLWLGVLQRYPPQPLTKKHPNLIFCFWLVPKRTTLLNMIGNPWHFLVFATPALKQFLFIMESLRNRAGKCGDYTVIIGG